MKIACVIHSLDGGGAERVMAALCSQFAHRGHRVTLITLDDGTRDRHVVDEAVTRHPLDVMGNSPHLFAKFNNTRRRIAKLREAVRATSPQVVLSFCDRTNLLTLLAARRLDVPVVVSERSDPSQQNLGVVAEFLRRTIYRRAAAVVALTEASASYLRASTAANVCVIPSAVETPTVTSDRSQAARLCRLVGVGRLEREKGFDRLIDAFAKVAAGAPDWSLRILGEGSARRQLEDQARTLGLSKRVSFPGWVQPIWSELGEATIFALPSRYEGFPSALLEAMAIGVPSIAVDCPSGPRTILNAVSGGWLVENDTESLAQAIGWWIAHPEQREQQGQVGKQVLDHFGWQAMLDRYENLIGAAVDPSGAAKP